MSFGMWRLTRTGIIAFSLQAFLDDVVAAFTANRMTTEDQLVGADMQFMGLGSVPDGGEWKLFSSCTCVSVPSIPSRY